MNLLRDQGPQAREAAERDIARKFADAFSRDDIGSYLELLTDQCWLSVPPASERYVGLTAVGSFLRARAEGRPGGS